jgi:hypothetical protein
MDASGEYVASQALSLSVISAGKSYSRNGNTKTLCSLPGQTPVFFKIVVRGVGFEPSQKWRRHPQNPIFFFSVSKQGIKREECLHRFV